MATVSSNPKPTAPPPTNSVSVDATTNRITGSPYAYDANGNMTNDGNNTLVYDAENRVLSATNGGASGTYTYDGNSLRVKRVSGGTTTIYIFSGAKVIAEYSGTSAPYPLAREYIYSGSSLLAKIESGATKYYHPDHLSNRVVADSSGSAVAQLGHYPFGESWYNASNDKLLFTSYERDVESSNDYAMMRSSVNRLGRFSSPDPLYGFIGNPQSFNRFAYAANDPQNLVDPLGLSTTSLFPCWETENGYVCIFSDAWGDIVGLPLIYRPGINNGGGGGSPGKCTFNVAINNSANMSSTTVNAIKIYHNEHTDSTEGVRGNATVKAWTVKRGGEREVRWTLKEIGNEGRVQDRFYRVTAWGCCDAPVVYSYYSVLTGRKLYVSNSDLLEVRGDGDGPLAARYVAFGYAGMNELSRPPQLQYGTDKKVAQRFSIVSSREYYDAPQIFVSTNEKVEKSLDLRGSPMDFTIVLKYQDGVELRVPVAADAIRPDLAQLPKGYSLRAEE